MASSIEKIADLMAAVSDQELHNILKERGIVAFSQNIRMEKQAKYGTRHIKVCLDIHDCHKLFTIYLDKEKTPVMEFDHLHQLEAAVSDQIKPGEVQFIRAMLEELDSKKVKFSAPHSYYFAIGENAYLIDSGTTKERALNIKSLLKYNHKPYHILSSHYHPDHWANNVLLAAGNTRIYVHHADKQIFEHGYHVLMYNYMAKFFQSVDVTNAIQRNLRLSKKMLSVTDFLIRKTPAFAVLAFQIYNMKFVERFRSGKKHFYYLTKETEQSFSFPKLSMPGWEIDKGLLALETPGHSYDHLAFYIVDQKTLFTGEIDVFLNPVSIIDCPPPLIHTTIDKIIQLVKSEKIDLLLPSHYMPISGNEKIIEHLTQQRDKLKHCYQSICEIVLESDSWEFKKLMQVVYESPKEIIREAVRVNWPKTISNLDIYVVFVLQELGYMLTDSLTKTWEVNK